MAHGNVEEIRHGRLSAIVLCAALSLLAAAARAQTVPNTFPPSTSGSCTPDEHTLCLVGGRFSVVAFFQPTPTGPSFEARAVPFTDNSGYFWFFDPSNVEIVVKVLNACVDPFDSYWVFAAGLTNVAVVMTVTDLLTGATRQYENALGMPFAPIQDTTAFSTCP